MTFIKLYRNESFYNNVLLQSYTFLGSLLKIFKQLHIAAIQPNIVLVQYAVCQVGYIFGRGIEGDFVPFMPSYHSPARQKTLSICIGFVGA